VGIGAMGSRQQKALLQEFSQTHPVGYVRRDRAELQKFLGCTDAKFYQTFMAGNEFYESCSNFEFYNLTQTTTSLDAPSASHLRLKEVEKL
jgi:succinate dehydrogenase flavin-adding protein (antitoxin of CptAB toxin-antitoxin module)